MSQLSNQVQKVTIGDATLYCGDCLTLIPEIEDFHALVTDPPYSSGGTWISSRSQQSSSKYTKALKYAYKQFEVLGDNKDALSWGYWATLWLSLCHARLPEGAPAVCFSDWRQLPNASNVFQSSGFVWRGVGVFAKHNYRRQVSRFAHQAEYFLWGSKGPMPIDVNKKALPGVFEYSTPVNQNRQHMTQKPLGLMADIMDVCPEGGTVFDPFMGVATTGIAALQSGRKFIGIEMHPEYFKLACERVETFYRDKLST